MSITILIISIILMGLSIAGWWFHTSRHEALKWSFRLDEAITLDESAITGPPITLKFGGKVPKKIYIQNSTDLVLSANPAFEPDYELREITVSPQTTIEVKLLVADFDIGGEPIQRKVITKETTDINFQWIISPKKAGNQKLILLAQWIDEHKIPHEIDSRTFEVKVTQHFGLSNSQYLFVNFVVGSIGVLGIIFGILDFFKP